MSKVVIADKYQCPKMDGKYSKEHKKLVRKGAKVTQDYVDRINDEDNGAFYVVDHEATEANHAKRNQRGMLQGLPKLEIVGASNKPAPSKTNEATAKPKLADLRLAYPNISASSVDKFLEKVAEFEKANAATGGGRLTSPPTED